MPSGMVSFFRRKGAVWKTASPPSPSWWKARTYVLGRLGIPYREKGLSVICLVLDAPMDVINALTGKLGRLPGVSAKAVTPRGAK